MPHDKSSDSLLDKLAGDSSDSISDNIIRSDGLSDDDLKKKEEQDDYELGRWFKELKGRLGGFGFGCIKTISIILIISFLILMCRYCWYVVFTDGVIQDVVSSILTFVAGIVATLAFEKVKKS